MYTYLITDIDGKNTVGEYLSLVSFTSLCALVVTMCYAAATCRPNALLVIGSYALYKGIAVVIDIMHAADQKAHRMDYIGISLAAQGILSLCSFTLIFYFSHDLVASILAMAVTTLAVGILYDLPKTKRPVSLEIWYSQARCDRVAFQLFTHCRGKHRDRGIRIITATGAIRHHGRLDAWYLRLRRDTCGNHTSRFHLYLQSAHWLFCRASTQETVNDLKSS